MPGSHALESKGFRIFLVIGLHKTRVWWMSLRGKAKNANQFARPRCFHLTPPFLNDQAQVMISGNDDLELVWLRTKPFYLTSQFLEGSGLSEIACM